MNSINNSLLWKLLNASVFQYVGLFACIFVGVVIVYYVRQFLSTTVDLNQEDRKMLSQAEKLYRSGEITSKEYQIVKANVSKRLKQRLTAELESKLET